MNIFVTGGSGFLGKRLIQRLLRDHHQVTAIARSNQSALLLEELGATVIQGSLETIRDWEVHLQGQNVVIHCAAPVELWGAWDKFYQDITLATKNLLQRSSKMNVNRFIYISSESVLQDTTPLVNIDEHFPYPVEPNSYYGKAKKLAELEILNFSSNMHSIILRPTYIWGKGDKTPQILEEKIKTGKFFWIDNGQCMIETVHVDNLVEAIVLACTRGNDREIYFVTDDDPISVREYFTQLLNIRGIHPPDQNLPGFFAKPMATLVETFWKIMNVRNPPPISRFELSFVALPRKYNISKIKQELGYQPIITRADGLRQLN